MEKVTLEVKSRDDKGKKVSKRYREKGLVPAVFYGKDLESQKLLVNADDLRQIVKHHGINVLLDIVHPLDKKTYTTMIKELQYNYLGSQMLHVDLFFVALDKPIEMDVPVHVTGRAQGELEGGIVDQNKHSLPVVCLPTQMPEYLTIDVSPLVLGQSLHVRDITLPEGMHINMNGDETVISILIPRGIKEEEEAEAAVAEGEEVPATEEAEAGEPELVTRKGHKEEQEEEKEKEKEKGKTEKA
jgi:large subunit ribosomal protein L25